MTNESLQKILDQNIEVLDEMSEKLTDIANMVSANVDDLRYFKDRLIKTLVHHDELINEYKKDVSEMVNKDEN